MPIPTWVDGNPLPASDVNDWLVDDVVMKTSAEHRSNNTLANDNTLVLPVKANSAYLIDIGLLIDGATNGDFQGAWTIPASATIVNVWGTGTDTAGSAYSNDITFAGGTTISLGCLGAGTMTGYRGVWSLTTLGTAGNLQFRWAQLTTSATADTIVNSGSYLRTTKVG
jgi:hypothetical protein